MQCRDSETLYRIVAVLTLVAVILVACGGATSAPTPTTAPAPAPTQAPTEAPATPGSAPTQAPAATEPPAVPAKPGLAPGMIGGPTGFAGAERYQYGPDSPAGRAILGLRALPDDRKCTTLRIQLAGGAEGHFLVGYPEGAPAVAQLFEEETGIKLDVVTVPADDQFTKIIQDVTTGGGQYDIYSFWGPDKGSLAEAGALARLDEYVAKYKPEWEKYYTGGETTVQQFNVYGGHYVAVAFDGDYQIWIYRKDLFEDPQEQAAFKARYGYDLKWPETWEQLDQISEFFHRPEQGLIGVTDLRNQYWGFTNWYQRYVSGGIPNQMYFDPETARPLIDSPAGVQATREYAETLKWHSPDALSWGWPEQYANMAAGGTAITAAFPNMPKFLDNPANPDSKVVGKLASGVTPGRIIDGKLVRRTVWWPNVTLGVSGRSQCPEAAYLFLQWANSPSIYPWMVANPAGFMDPFQVTDFEDPIVISSYHEYQVESYKQSIPRAVPPININGTNEYVAALETQLQAVIAGSKTPEQAMRDAAAEWEQITDRLGRDKQIAALKAQMAAWPTVVDEPSP